MATTIGGPQPPNTSSINIPDTTAAGTTEATTPPPPSIDAQTRQAEAAKQYANDNKPQNDVRAGYMQQQLDKA